MLPGVQVLFAFLLAVPFTNRWEKVSETQTDAYSSLCGRHVRGSILLIAPSAYHRIRWREVSDEQLLRVSNSLAIAGTTCLAVGMTAAVFLITDLVYKAARAALGDGSHRGLPSAVLVPADA